MSDDMDIEFEWEGPTPEDLEREMGAILDRAEVSQLAAMEAFGLKAEADTKRNIRANEQIDTGNMIGGVESRTRRTMRGGIETRVVVPAEYGIWQELANPFLRPSIDSNIALAERLLGETLVDPFDGSNL